MSPEELAIEAVIKRFKGGKLKLTKSIKSLVDDKPLKEISVNNSTDASFYMNAPLRQEVIGDFFDIICDLTGLTSDQVSSMHKDDYMALVIYVGKS